MTPDTTPTEPKAESLDLTVLIPVYNEEENLTPLVEELSPVVEGLERSYEVLFVDDGSTDGTYPLLLDLQKRFPHIRLIKLKRNTGKTPAMVAGWTHAAGEVVVIMDGDLQNDPRDIAALLEQIPQYDLAIGYRVNRRDTWFRRVQSRIANWVRDRVIRDGIRDSGCAFVAFRREPILTMTFYVGLHRFIPAMYQLHGYRTTQVPVNHRPRLHGEAKFNLRNRAIRAFNDLMAVRWIRSHRIEYEIEEERG